MQNIASIASLDGKFSNSSGRKTVIQALRYDFDPLEISKLTGHANPDPYPVTAIILWKNSGSDNYQWRFKSCFTGDYSQQLSPPSNAAVTSNRDSRATRSSYLMKGAQLPTAIQNLE